MSGTDLEILIPKLRRFARALYCSKSEADEAVCDSLEAAMEAGHVSGHEIVTTGFWLFNVLIDGARRRFANDGGRPAGFRVSSYPADIEQALAELSVEHRAVIALHVLEGVGLKDVAAILGTSTFKVRESLSLAREHLAERTARQFNVLANYNVPVEQFGPECRD